MVLEISQACLDDLDEIMALEHKGFAGGIIEEKAVFAERIRHFANGFFLGRESQSHTLIAYLSAEIWPYQEQVDPARFSLNHSLAEAHDETGGELYISSMTLDPAYRGRGIGRELFEGAIASLRDHYPQLQSLILIVNATWLPAQAIYRGYGLGEIGRIRGFFTPEASAPQDAIIMRKSF